MTQAKTGAFLSMGRLPQFVGQAALAASVLAGGASLLNAGGAMAATDTFPPTPFIPPAVENGATITGLTGPTVGTGDVEFDYAGLISGRPSWTVDVDFKPNLPGVYGPATFEYSLMAPGLDKWQYAALTQNVIGGSSGAEVRKQIFDFTGGVQGALLYDSGFIIDSAGTPLVAFTPTSQIKVVDTYKGGATALLDNYINTVQTPGPLPILGAGAAFGFSRKLRSRIKAGRTA
jgi:hypothetical protein